MAQAAEPDATSVAYDLANFFVLRAAVLPIDALRADPRVGSEAENRPPDFGPPALDGPDLRLQAWIRDPFVRAAIYLASPNLSQRLSDWLSNPTADGFSSLRGALFRYFVRMTTRATPFGLMASFTTGRVGSSSRLELGSREAIRRSTWFDLGFVYPLVDRLVRRSEVRRELGYTLNTTFFRHGDEWRYVEQIEGSKQRERILTRVAASEATDLVADFCRGRDGVKPTELIALIVGRLRDVEESEAGEFVDQLIDAQILVPTLAPTLTGVDPVQHLLRRSDGVASLADFHRAFRAASDRLAEIDRSGTGSLGDSYRDLAASLQSEFGATGERDLFHVDMRRLAPELALDRAIVPSIAAAVETLRRICPASRTHRALERFRVQFEERYGDREVDLLAALDEDAGIGFDVDPASRRNEGLLKDFAFETPTDDEGTRLETRRIRLLVHLLERAHLRDQLAIDLTEEDIERLTAADARPLPDVFTVLGSLGPCSAADDAGKPCFVLASVSSGAGLFGRFCRADPELNEHLKNLLRKEEALRPDAVFAEIVHLPQDRTGNIVCRPALRSKDLPYLGQSGLDAADRILASDLVVCVRARRIVLRSRSLGCEVLPRITCAQHAQGQNASVYRFLAALALQDGTSGLKFSWGACFDEAAFLPRITLGRVILAPASWRIGPAEALAWSRCAPRDRRQAVSAWRAKRKTPQWVQVGQDDNLLSLDLEDGLCVDALLEEVVRTGGNRIREMVPAPGELCVSSPEGHHVHEIMLPFVRRAQAPMPGATRGLSPGGASERRFAPGSRWLYVKLYGSSLATERALAADLFDWIQTRQAAASFDRWHFVRYRDTDEHLRLRFHGEAEALRLDVRPKLEESFRRWSNAGAIWRLQYDTYEREVNRYGGPEAIEFAESIFHADSEAVVELLRNAPTGRSKDWRWLLSMKLVDCYSEAFGLEPNSRREAFERVERSFRIEFRVGGAFEGELSRRYRADRKLIEGLIGDSRKLPERLAWAQDAISRFQARLKPLAAWFLARAPEQLTASTADIARSLAHMHVNRMMLANPREHEFIMYAFLNRAYRSRLARAVDDPRTRESC